MGLLDYVLNRRSFLKAVAGVTVAAALPVPVESSTVAGVKPPGELSIKPPDGAWIQIDDYYFPLDSATIDIKYSLAEMIDLHRLSYSDPMITVCFTTKHLGNVSELPPFVDVGNVKTNFPGYGVIQLEDARIMSMVYDLTVKDIVTVNGEIISQSATVIIDGV